MKTHLQIPAIALILLAGGAGAVWITKAEKPVAVDSHGHDEHGHGEKVEAGHEGHDHGAELVKLSAKQLENARLTFDQAGPGVLRERLMLNGIIQPDQEQLAQIAPRFPGIVGAVTRRLGDEVKKDEDLITIESDESLKVYTIPAPISGTVIDRKVTLGEHVDRSDKMMTIANLSNVWIDFRVFPQDFNKLKVGQAVEFTGLSDSGPVKATISYISPIGMTDTQSMLARASVANRDRALRPGLFVTGHALLSEQKAAVVVRESAIQYVEGKPVVFVRDGDGFKPSEIEIGARDGQFAEVLFGVVAGDSYVSGASYILKAELGKAEASHSHSH